MLDFYIDEKNMVLETSLDEIIVPCDVCNKEAFIFQDEGNFCLNCWQERTEPDITIIKESVTEYIDR